jgi:TatD DNase family protein
VIERAIRAGVDRVVITAGTVAESRRAVAQARAWNQQFAASSNNHNTNGSDGGGDGGNSPRPIIHFSCTVGVHPTRCRQVFEQQQQQEDEEGGCDPSASAPAAKDLCTSADALLDELLEIALDGMQDGTVVAIGEIGLDYDRLEFCPADIQKKYLVRQLEHLARPTGLPLFLHNRSVGDDLYTILNEHRHCWNRGGVVHSFDDSLELAMKFIDDLGLYIGLNGCSLRNDENLQVVASIPLEKILLETE